MMATNVFGELVLAGGHTIANRTWILAIQSRRRCCLRFRLQATQIDPIRCLLRKIRSPIVVVGNIIIIQAAGATILFAHRLPLAQILAAHNILVRMIGPKRTLMLGIVIDIDVIIIVVILVFVIVVVRASAQVLLMMMANVFVVQFGGTCVALQGKRGGIVGGVVGDVGAGSTAAARCGPGADVHWLDGGVRVR